MTLKKEVVQIEVSKAQWKSEQLLIQDSIEKQLRQHCLNQGLDIYTLDHKRTPSFILTEEGVMVETIVAACIALTYPKSR